MNFILSLSDLVLRTSAMPSNLPIQPTKPSPIYSPNNRFQSRPLDSLNPNPVDSKAISEPELQCETELERTSSIPTIQDSIHNPYIFRAVMPLPYTFKAPLFTRINVTDFLKRFEDIVTDYGLSDNRKIQRVQKYCEFGIAQRIQDLDSYEEKDWKGLMKEMKAIYKDGDIDQQRYTRAYLITLAYKARGEKKVNLYNRQFRLIAKKLIKKRQFKKDNAINIKKLMDKAINIAKIKQKFLDFTKPPTSVPEQTKR